MRTTFHCVVLASIGMARAQSPAQSPMIGQCPVFPTDNIWNARVDALPIGANSAAYVATIGADKPLVPDFGSGLFQGGLIGIPFILVSGSRPRVPVVFGYADESDPGPYPIPPGGPVEGGAQSTGDRHVLALDRDHCILYELFSAYPQLDGSWKAGSGAIWDLRSNALRPARWTSADAAGFPIVPGLMRYEEVAAGEIRHAIRFTVPKTRREYVWPATHFASSSTDARYPPMGIRFRLRADFDSSAFSAENRVILQALKRYGMLLADNGSPWFISGAPDERWNNEKLRELRQVRGSDFEAVDTSSLELDAGSAKARQTPRNIVNAASFAAGAIAPSEIVTVARLGIGGAETRVLFSGASAALLYVSPDQINAVVPDGLGGVGEADIEVSVNGAVTYKATVALAAAAPGLFGALNQDLSPNTEATPAERGSVAILFATGGGGLPTAVRIGGVAADVSFAGDAPGFIGLTQVNARVPGGIGVGRVPLLMLAGSYPSQADTYLFVK